MARVALTYRIPFISRVTMLPRFARWLASLSQPPNSRLLNEPEMNGAVTWDYDRHGWIPWMEFFYDWRFGDITGDGRIDMILTCGSHLQVAYLHDGSVLWRYEDPKSTCLDIRMDSNFPIYDLDGDGRMELVGPRRIGGRLHLCLIDALTGETKKSVPYPDRDTMPKNAQGGHFRSSVSIVNALGRANRREVLVGWDYRSVTLLDADLETLWKLDLSRVGGRRHTTMGHTPDVADIDGDGRDEVLAGSCLIDHDGTLSWVAPDLEALLRDGHADSVRIASLDGEPRILMSTGAYCFSRQGELLWGIDGLRHGQALRVGKIRDDLACRQVVVYEGASRGDPRAKDRVLALDADGNLLWSFEVVQPDMQEGGFGFWLGDWNGDGLDEVFVNDREEVVVLDGWGRTVDRIPGHLVYVFDLVGDRRSEAVVLTDIGPGMELRVMANDRPNPNPATSRVVRKRRTTKEMYNATRY